MICRALLVLAFFSLVTINAFAQSYIDLINIRYWTMPGWRIGDEDGFQHHYFNITGELPFKIKDHDVIVVSPLAERWRMDSTTQGDIPDLNGYTLPITWAHDFRDSPWGFSLTSFFRWNAQPGVKADAFQLGGAGTIAYKFTDVLKLRVGCYVNNEFFGIHVIPLLGVDWHVSDDLNIFGVMPGRLIVEKKINTKFYFGVNYRGITNSYLLTSGDYIRIDQSQTAAFIDYYLTKKLVVNFDAGYSFLPKVRSGRGVNKEDSDLKDIDGLFFKISIAWRIRMDDKW